jgi:Protein of unknown function (DUF3307)
LSWAAVLAAFVVSHLVGDFLLQTEWQALTKPRGLSEPEGRRAIALHTTTYMLAFVPALVWIGHDTSAGRAIAVAAVIAIPHVLLDDGRFVSCWMTQVKHAPQPALWLTVAVDQSFHLVCLLGAALVAAS